MRYFVTCHFPGKWWKDETANYFDYAHAIAYAKRMENDGAKTEIFEAKKLEDKWQAS